MGIQVVIQPAAEPVVAAEVRLNSGFDSSAKDSIIGLYIKALRQYGENYCGRKFITQTCELTLDAFPVADIDLQLPDVQGITSVKYIDANGVEQTLASNQYVLDSASTAAWLLPGAGVSWPATLATANAVKVRFTVGYGATADDVDSQVKLWILVRASMLLDNPDSYVDGTLRELPLIDQMLHTQRIYS